MKKIKFLLAAMLFMLAVSPSFSQALVTCYPANNSVTVSTNIAEQTIFITIEANAGDVMKDQIAKCRNAVLDYSFMGRGKVIDTGEHLIRIDSMQLSVPTIYNPAKDIYVLICKLNYDTFKRLERLVWLPDQAQKEFCVRKVMLFGEKNLKKKRFRKNGKA